LAELFKRTKQAKYTYLFNIGIFREQQMFFKWYGGFTEALDTFTYFFAEQKGPKVVTATRKTNVVVSGDTRFDRVAIIDNTLDYISQFKMIL
jgi:3-deoxy-D-manno-octulosonic-acid transferase